MSFKMLIVDDEPIISRGLKDTIPWEKYNIEVIGTANDGRDAINKINVSETIDLVITDVRMPNLDGLGLANYLHEHYPKVRTIIVSGYDEFAYAQQALKAGVKDYLLKPVNIDELVNKVQDIISELIVEQKDAEANYQTVLKNAIFNQVSNFPVRLSKTNKKIEEIRVYPFISVLQDYSKTLNNLTEQAMPNIKSLWKNGIDKTLSNNGYQTISIFTNENVLLTCLLEYEQDSCAERVRALLTDTTWNERYDLMYVWSESPIKLAELNRKFTDLLNNIRYLPLQKDGSVVIHHTEQQGQQVYPIELETKIVTSILEMDKEDIHRYAKELFEFFETEQYFLDEVVQVCSEIIIKLINRIQSLRNRETVQIELHYKKWIDVRLYNSYQLLKELFEDDLNVISSKLDVSEIGEKDWLIKRAEAYIKEFYQSNLLVNEVADVVNISPNYFSTLFKQKTGENFNSYVNDLRIEEAKTLLAETPLKVSEIAEQVGFKEYKYFVDVFKRFSGTTPTNYRKFIDR
ncbi:response regulator [Radiobacillus sp. PE A8.2]|uniref:response regulator transcription factor n=1 Tax=Radiobacillus sp. PE A8.2 TaxID=3380349 RepID=UPI00389035FA